MTDDITDLLARASDNDMHEIGRAAGEAIARALMARADRHEVGRYAEEIVHALTADGGGALGAGLEAGMRDGAAPTVWPD